MSSLIEGGEKFNRERLLNTLGVRRLARLVGHLRAASKEAETLYAEHWQDAGCPDCTFCEWADSKEATSAMEWESYLSTVIFQADVLADLLDAILPTGAVDRASPVHVLVMATAM